MHFPVERIEQLISIGQEIEKGSGDLTSIDSSLGWLKNVYHHDQWTSVCQNLSTDKHIALLKAVTLAYSRLNIGGGSVAAPIWIYRVLDERICFCESCHIAKWMIDHSLNDWIPFGSSIKRNIFLQIPDQEYTQISGSLYWYLAMIEWSAKEEKARKHQLIENRQKEAKAARLEEKQIKQKEHQSRGKILVEKRKKLIGELSPLPIRERIAHVANDDNHTVHYYPEEWAALDDCQLKDMDSSTREKLIYKTKAIKAGRWKVLRNKLKKLQQ